MRKVERHRLLPWSAIPGRLGYLWHPVNLPWHVVVTWNPESTQSSLSLPYLLCFFGKYFVPVRGLSSYPLDSSFHKQVFLISTKSRWSVISFPDGAFGVGSEKLSPHPRSPIFSRWKEREVCSRFILLAWTCLAICWKDWFCSSYSFALLSLMSWLCSWGLYSVPQTDLGVLRPVSHGPGYCHHVPFYD